MISVHRVYWWTDWVKDVREAMWGCAWGRRHRWNTVKFAHVATGTTFVNECSRCGEQVTRGSWRQT